MKDISSQPKLSPQRRNLLKTMGFSARSFQRHVSKLKTRGILTVHNAKSSNGMIAANQYSLPGWAEFVSTHQKIAA